MARLLNAQCGETGGCFLALALRFALPGAAETG
jgi:hypothetical protein